MRILKSNFTMLFLLAFCISLTACTEPQNHPSVLQSPSKRPEIISFSFSAKYALSVGYGDVYHCTLNHKNAEVAGMEEFNLVVVAGEVVEQLGNQDENAQFLGIFQRFEDDAPYNMNPVTGFTDKNRTIWKLLELH